MSLYVAGSIAPKVPKKGLRLEEKAEVKAKRMSRNDFWEAL